MTLSLLTPSIASEPLIVIVSQNGNAQVEIKLKSTNQLFVHKMELSQTMQVTIGDPSFVSLSQTLSLNSLLLCFEPPNCPTFS